MAEPKFEVNKRLDVVWDGRIYKSSVQDLAEDYLAIAAPISEGLYLPLHRGDSFLAYYYINDKELYEFDGLVGARKIEGNIQLIILEYPKEVRLVQRREFVRVDVNLPIKYVVSDFENDLKNTDVVFAEGKAQKATLLDISGGGMRINTVNNIEIGKFVTVDMNLLGTLLRISGKIARTVKDDNGNYNIGIAYFDISERVRDKIIRLIFDIMRKQLKST